MFCYGVIDVYLGIPVDSSDDCPTAQMHFFRVLHWPLAAHIRRA